MRVAKAYLVRDAGGDRTIRPVGRDAWMLDRLLAVGIAGTTSLETPAPRVSHYVFKLRTVHGLNIETVTETHDGPFSGSHARYILRSDVTPAGELASRLLGSALVVRAGAQ